MYLSQLQLTGFKSYTEPVIVNFDQKISVIIGSNGVGKSNALDAVLWALGEDRPSKLRCSSKYDLIFSGSNISPPCDVATVELTFEHKETETVVSRSLTKSGNETLLVSGEKIKRLSDYKTVLDQLGFGYARSNVIRQEELTDFFSKDQRERQTYLDKFEALLKINQINEYFQNYIDAILPGCKAKLTYREGQPITVEVIFPDKGPRRGFQLSGGEKASTALALKLALFQSTPSPMYLMDEIEPSLDWTRNHNMQDLLKELSDQRQLVIITHFQSTIRMANTVHGVRIRPDGSSWLKFHFVMDDRLFKIYKCC
jgi:chromosome segregation ATPase